MGTPQLLSRKIADLTLDTALIAKRCTCCVGDVLRGNLRRLTTKTDVQHTAKLAGRAIEDYAIVSPWTERHLAELQRVEELDQLERDAIPRSLQAG